MDLVSQKLPKINKNYYNGSDTIRPEWTELGRSEEAGVLVVGVIPPALLVGATAVVLFVVLFLEDLLFVILFVGHNSNLLLMVISKSSASWRV